MCWLNVVVCLMNELCMVIALVCWICVVSGLFAGTEREEKTDMPLISRNYSGMAAGHTRIEGLPRGYTRLIRNPIS